jgi:hypothetical protein
MDNLTGAWQMTHAQGTPIYIDTLLKIQMFGDVFILEEQSATSNQCRTEVLDLRTDGEPHVEVKGDLTISTTLKWIEGELVLCDVHSRVNGECEIKTRRFSLSKENGQLVYLTEEEGSEASYRSRRLLTKIGEKYESLTYKN